MDDMLVTGASGFVGQAFVKTGLAEKQHMTALGRTSPGAGIDFIQCDLTNPEALERAVGNRQFTSVVHIASLPGDTGNPQQMVCVNVNGCLNLLDAARRMKVQRFVLASSISAYGWYPATKFNPPDNLPVDENHPCRPKDMYSTTKRIQEQLVQTYHDQHGLPTVILRLTGVIGPRGRGGGRGWRNFAESLAAGKRVQIPHLTTEEVCHYVDSRDVAQMLLVAATHPGAVGEIFNCCGPAPTSGHEFIQAVKELFPGIEVDTGFPWSMAQGGVIYFDMAKAKQLLGFVPRYGLLQSIKSIKDWIDTKGLESEPIAPEDRAFASGVVDVS
jgi:UDP-glucuronate 4-epimerase